MWGLLGTPCSVSDPGPEAPVRHRPQHGSEYCTRSTCSRGVSAFGFFFFWEFCDIQPDVPNSWYRWAQGQCQHTPLVFPSFPQACRMVWEVRTCSSPSGVADVNAVLSPGISGLGRHLVHSQGRKQESVLHLWCSCAENPSRPKVFVDLWGVKALLGPPNLVTHSERGVHGRWPRGWPPLTAWALQRKESSSLVIAPPACQVDPGWLKPFVIDACP